MYKLLSRNTSHTHPSCYKSMPHLIPALCARGRQGTTKQMLGLFQRRDKGIRGFSTGPPGESIKMLSTVWPTPFPLLQPVERTWNGTRELAGGGGDIFFCFCFSWCLGDQEQHEKEGSLCYWAWSWIIDWLQRVSCLCNFVCVCGTFQQKLQTSVFKIRNTRSDLLVGISYANCICLHKCTDFAGHL